MSCIGEEVFEDASRVPIVDIVDGQDIITESAVLQVTHPLSYILFKVIE